MSSIVDRIRNALQEHYLILQELGQGSAAIVYLAEDRKHHRQVALKVLRPEVAAEVGAQRFIREIETVSQLSHPHILPLFDSGEADGLPWFVMPYMPGESLRERLAHEHQLPLDEALDIVRDVAGALAYAHSLGIVHRDIKPGNILLSGGRAIVADFGVALAISAAIEGERDRPGELFGTPLYMSPEQFTGSTRIDRRSDLYSLGCVLYEMIEGSPPFTGPSTEALRAQHLAAPPPSLRDSQRNMEPGLVDVVDRLLAKTAADRFVTAQQLIDTLPTARRISARMAAPRRVARAGRWMALSTAAAGLIAVASVVAARALNPPVSGVYAVVSAEGKLAGQDSRPVAAVRAELEHWNDSDIDVVPEIKVVDDVREHGPPTDLEDLASMARRLRAARFVRLETRPTGQAVSLSLALYELGPLAGNTALQTETVQCAAADAACDSALAVATRRLLVPGAGVPELRSPGTSSLVAYRTWVEGRHAYGRWDLPEAEARFLDATRFDPRFARAHLDLAEVRWWMERPAPEWREQATAYLTIERDGSLRSRGRAQALVHLADRRFVEACVEFDRLLAADSLDFAAWYGRGECLRNDRVVLPSRKSPSGWAFRASVNEALASYERALAIAPVVHRGFGARAYEKAASLFYVDEYRVQAGYLEEDQAKRDSIAFGAWPDLIGDTLTFIPWPLADVLMGEGHTRATNQFRAVLRNRSRVAELTARWVHAFPESPGAHLGRAEALESLREGGQEGGWREVLFHAGEARRLAGPDRSLQTAASVASVRLLLKAERYADAKALADSILAGPLPSDTASVRQLASVAALTGRIRLAVSLTAEGARDLPRYSLDGQRFLFSTPLSQASLALLVYSSFGVPAESIVALEHRIEQLVRAGVGEQQLLAVRTLLLARPAALAFPSMGLRPAHGSVDARHIGIRLQRYLADGNHEALLAEEAAEAQRFSWRPSSVNVDAVYLTAIRYLAIGDTANAIRWANGSLTSLAGYGRDLLAGDPEGSIPQMATLPRLMALRADLAARDRDTETARRWAAAVTALWADADPPLQPTVARMRDLEVAGAEPR